MSKIATSPAKIEPFRHLLGTVRDRVVAKKAHVSIETVRRYRISLGIANVGWKAAEVSERREMREDASIYSTAVLHKPAPAPAIATPAPVRHAYTVTVHALDLMGPLAGRPSFKTLTFLAIGTDMADAARSACSVRGFDVLSIERYDVPVLG